MHTITRTLARNEAFDLSAHIICFELAESFKFYEVLIFVCMNSAI